MNTKHTHGPLYAKNAGGGAQGLIIDEATGATVALTYQPEHAPIIVRACNAHDDLVAILGRILAAHDSNNNGAISGEAKLCAQFADIARSALAKAKGE